MQNVFLFPLFQSLPQTPQSGYGSALLVNGGGQQHNSSLESVPEAGSGPDNVSTATLYTLSFTSIAINQEVLSTREQVFASLPRSYEYES